LFNRDIGSDPIDTLLLKWRDVAERFQKLHPDILFTRADKGNTTVALNKNEYLSQMMSLNDKDTYTVVNNDPTKKVISKLTSLISEWKKLNYIDNRTYKQIYCSDGPLPRAYGLPKIHKPNNPLRLIISSINSPLFGFSEFLQDILQKSIPNPNSYIKNSLHLVNQLEGKVIDDQHTLISLDVVSLFTNVPVELVVDSVTKRWDLISQKTKIPLEQFIIAIRFIMESTFFTFNKIIYKQIFGTPMGSPLSPIIADLVMQDIETKAIEKLPCALPFFYRYVDDIILAVPIDLVDCVLNTFNLIHRRLQFIMEREKEGRIGFLEILIIREHRNFIFDIYHKPTFSGKFLNFHSHHPISHKKGLIISLTDKIVKLSHPKFHSKNLLEIIE